MASFGVGFTIFSLLHLILLLAIPVSSDEEGDLLNGLNSYRQSHNVQSLTKHDKADCLANEIADELEDRQYNTTGINTTSPGVQSSLPNYPDLVKKCVINITTTQEGVILPVCVPKRVATLVLRTTRSLSIQGI